jgi:hypothetical protein
MANELIINGALTPVVFSKLMRRNLDPQSVFYDLVNRDYEGEIKNKGDRVVIRQAGDITVKDYVKGTPMQYEDPEANKMELVIDQKKYFAFDIEDIDQVQSDISGLVQKYIDRAQSEISLVKDTYISTKIWDGIHDGNMLETVALTKDNAYGTLTRLMGRLRWTSAIKNNGTGYDGKRPWLVVDPDVFGVLLETPQATKATEAGDKTTREGTVLRLAGFDIKVSNHSEDGAATRKIIAGTTEGFSYADQIAKTKIETDKDDFAQHASGLYLFGGVATQEKALAGLQVTLA